MSSRNDASECARARRAHSLVLDGEESTFAAELLAAHLAYCEECREYVSRVSAFTRRIRCAPFERRP
jgi:predicted anti-sigma-YlaC factor YlaD